MMNDLKIAYRCIEVDSDPICLIAGYNQDNIFKVHKGAVAESFSIWRLVPRSAFNLFLIYSSMNLKRGKNESRLNYVETRQFHKLYS